MLKANGNEIQYGQKVRLQIYCKILTLYFHLRCSVETFYSSYAAGLDAPYSVNAFNVTIDLKKPPRLWQ